MEFPTRTERFPGATTEEVSNTLLEYNVEFVITKGEVEGRLPIIALVDGEESTVLELCACVVDSLPPTNTVLGRTGMDTSPTLNTCELVTNLTALLLLASPTNEEDDNEEDVGGDEDVDDESVEDCNVFKLDTSICF